MNEAEAIFLAAKIWVSIGSLVAIVFLTIGIDRIDEDARGAYIFRPLLIPAILIIWPLVLWRWYVLETKADRWPTRYRPPRKIHFAAAVVSAVLIVSIIVVGLSKRQTWPSGFEPTKISENSQ